ncbi:CBS domain-containing protein [Nocardioides nitrophenolicus]|uniref:CBS domain-containing protein n=1 Tax=Nocardioides nitrophenolicus TaxID=60489 RepID=UPI00195E89F8|nr:CBS domain-containing protein [Nocardioides nitrophenolicus]MBM7515671.1 putative transcriptional regulator [Nocardioides nitrophenolicus]
MSPHPVTVRTDLPLGAAARLLARHAVTALPVVDERSRVVGVISEADILAGSRLTDSVGSAMSRVIALVHPETDVAELRAILTRTGVKSLPVVDAADQVVGVVSRSDVVRAFAHDDEQLEADVADVLARARVSGCGVRVRNGIVQLTGLEATDEGRRAFVLDAVGAIPGVVTVRWGRGR